jgi:hypothetical protein
VEQAELARRAHWEQDGLGELFVFDCSNNAVGDAKPLFEAFHREVLSRPAGTVRVLADFENAVHDPAITKLYKDAHSEHDRQIRKIACLGINGGMKIVFAAYRFFVRIKGVDVDAKMRLFDDVGPARAWLLER